MERSSRNSGIACQAPFPFPFGSTWVSLGGHGSGLNGRVAALALDGRGQLYAGGRFSNAGGNEGASLFAVWDGVSWASLGAGLGTLGEVKDLVIDGAGDLFVVRDIPLPSLGSGHIAMRDGSMWHELGSGLGYPGRTLVRDGGSNIFVGGDFAEAGGKASVLIGRYSGATPTPALFRNGFESGDTTMWSASVP